MPFRPVSAAIAASAGISAFAAGYFRQGEGTAPGLLCLEYHVFLASMAGVVLADDAYAFMVMWETMALSSYFLVTANHRIAEVRGAGYLYITMARVGAIAILLCFGVLQAGTGDYTFASCWHIALIYIPPLALLYFGLIAASFLFALGVALIGKFRTKRRLLFVGHAVILSIGPFACNIAAHLASGDVSCL